MLKKIIKILTDTESIKCLRKAEALESEVTQTGALNFRSLDLTPSEISAIADVLEQEKNNPDTLIKSLSFSFNPLLGDLAATEIAKSLPSSLCELGLVGCQIGDKGGVEILSWMNNAPNLKMICIEQNNFSEELQMKFNSFKKANPHVMVVV